MKKLNNSEAELKKAIAYKKACILTLHNIKLLASVITKSGFFCFRVANGGFKSFVTLHGPQQTHLKNMQFGKVFLCKQTSNT